MNILGRYVIFIFITLMCSTSSAQYFAQFTPFAFWKTAPSGPIDACGVVNPVLGSTCVGGAIYAGEFDGGKYMITPGNCTDSATPTCNGSNDSLTKTWRGTTGTDADITGVETVVLNSTASSSSFRGHVNTPVIVADASISDNSAADYCNDMIYGGYDDWYLPSKSELAYIYCHASVPSHNASHPQEDPNCTSYGGKTSDFTNFSTGQYYWTSTEYSNDDAWSQGFSDGDQADNDPKSSSRHVRCVRRYGASTTAGLVHHYELDEISGTTASDSVGSIDGTLNNGPTWAPIGGIADGAVEFDGSNDDITAPNTANAFDTLPLSWSLWVKASQQPSADTQNKNILQLTHSLSPWHSYQLWADDADDNFKLTVRDSGGSANFIVSDNPLIANQWYHLVFTIDASANALMYVNGVQQTQTIAAGSLFTANNPLYFGSPAANQGWDGKIDDARFYNKVLNASEVSDLYNEGNNQPARNYFVLTNDSWDGDLGGLTGANAKCLNDLLNHDWEGRSSVALNGTTVKAFLCDGSNCQSPFPNATYTFARSGDTTAGTNTFTTDATGAGPGNSTNWTGTTYFNSSNQAWTGRANGTSTLWSLSSGADHCTGWTTNSGGVNGDNGDPNNTDADRWSNTAAACSGQRYLICMVSDNHLTTTNDDPYAENVVLFIQPDDNGSTIEDRSASAHTVTAVSGAALSTAVSDPFGGDQQVIRFDGTNDRLTVPDSDDFWMDSGDFTMDMWLNFDAMGATSLQPLLVQVGATNRMIYRFANSSDFGFAFGSNTFPAFGESGDRSTPTSQWAHIAWARNGNTIKIYLDGTEIATSTNASALANAAAQLEIGGTTSTGAYFGGYLSQIRFTKGVARYTSDFTPPTIPYDSNSLRRSMEFNGSDEELTRTPGSAGNRKTWTFSTWFKRDGSGNYETFFNANGVHLQIDTGNRIEWWDFGTAANIVVRSTATITDTDWHHIVFAMDTTQATATDRARVYLDGVEVTAFGADNRSQLTQNSDRELNSTISHRIGMNQYTEIFDGKLSDTYFIDGQQLGPERFGYDNNGDWTANLYSGLYGTNGFYLFSRFGPSASIGADKSGNGNDFTPVNSNDTNYSAQTPP